MECCLQIRYHSKLGVLIVEIKCTCLLELASLIKDPFIVRIWAFIQKQDMSLTQLIQSSNDRWHGLPKLTSSKIHIFQINQVLYFQRYSSTHHCVCHFELFQIPKISVLAGNNTDELEEKCELREKIKFRKAAVHRYFECISVVMYEPVDGCIGD